MTIELTREQEQLIEQQLATGNFTDKSEVIGEALALLKRQGVARAKIQAGVQRGIEDMEAGRYRTISTPEEAQVLADEIKERGRELREKREQAAH